MLHIAVTVHKDEIIVSIDSRLAFDTVFFLISALHLKCFLNPLDHRNLTLTGVSLGCIDAVIGSHLVAVVIVDQSVVHADKATLKVYVSPSEASELAHSHAGVEHDIENRIPMLIGVSLADKLQEKLLLTDAQGLSFLHLVPMSHFQFLQHFRAWVRTDVVIVHSDLKHLVEHVVNTVYS